MFHHLTEELSGDSVIISKGSLNHNGLSSNLMEKSLFEGNCIHVVPSTAKININKYNPKFDGEKIWNYAIDAARLKAEEVSDSLIQTQNAIDKSSICENCSSKDELMVIGLDVEIAHKNKIYGKPDNEDEAKQILKELSGTTHSVIYGVVILSSNKKLDLTSNLEERTEATFHSVIEVKFDKLADTIVQEYEKTGHWEHSDDLYGIKILGFNEYSLMLAYMDRIKML